MSCANYVDRLREELYAIFNNWKTARTIAMRRVVMSVSMLILGAYFIGVDASRFGFLGLSLQDGDVNRFYILIVMVLLVSASLFYLFSYIDSRLRAARVKDIEDMVDIAGSSYDNLSNIAVEYKVSTVELVIDYVGGKDDGENHLIESLKTLGFYRDYLEKPRGWNKLIDVSERVFVAMLTVLSLLVVLNNFS